jgi:hypothetical protein
MVQILEDFCICKQEDFDRNTLTELEQDYYDSSRDSRLKKRTNVCTKTLYVFMIISDEDESAGKQRIA